jgi:acetylglutamate kinase
MSAKLEAALAALDGGVERVRISDIAAIEDLGRGTVLTRVGTGSVYA